MTPTLGYPSRQAAVLALKAQGLRNVEIAQRIGVHPNVVGAFVHYGLRRDVDTRRVEIPGRIIRALRAHAEKRGVEIADLTRRILQAVVDGTLVDAVLDDGDAE